MKLCEVLKRINIISNLGEEEKIYLSHKRGYILRTGKLYGFDEEKNIIYRPKFTKEQFIDIQYSNALDILKGIETVHKVLVYVPGMPNIDLYDSDVSNHNNYYNDGTPISNTTFIKAFLNDHLVLIIYNQSDIKGFEMRVFDIDLVNYCMILHILEGKESSETIDCYTSSGNLSKESVLIIDKEINGENGQSTLNTSCDMYFESCSSYDDMIEKAKKSTCLKKQKMIKINRT